MGRTALGKQVGNDENREGLQNAGRSKSVRCAKSFGQGPIRSLLSSSASSDVCKSSRRISRHATFDPGDTRDGRAEDEGIAVAVAKRQIKGERRSKM